MIKILVVRHSPPDVKGYASILFENLLSILQNKTSVNIIWLVYGPQKISNISTSTSNITVVHIQDYENALDALQKIKPDITYTIPGYSYVEYAFMLASKFLKIPAIGGELGLPLYNRASTNTIIRSYLTQLCQRSVPGETENEKKQFMKRGRFFIYKYRFLIKTQKAIGITYVGILKNIIAELRRHFIQKESGGRILVDDSRFTCDFNFLDGEILVDLLVKRGFKRSSLILTGNPTYDKIFQRLENFQNTSRRQEKIRVLLITTNPDDPGGKWSKKLRDYWIKSVVDEISRHKNEMSLAIKIHPSSEIISEYTSIVNTIDPTIPVYQKEDIMKLLEEYDVVIGSSSSTAIVISLLVKKPIIIWNFFGVEGDVLLERNLVFKCQQRHELIPLIRLSLSSNPASEKKIYEFIHQFFYKPDGRASERIADIILEIVKRNNKTTT